MRIARTNEELKTLLGPDVLCSLVYQRLCKLYRWKVWDTFDPLLSAQLDLVDPVRIFVKNELHSAEKVATGRMRLISSVSSIDQMVERVLGDDQNKAEIANWATCPSKPGLGLHDDGLETIINEMKKYSDPVETDVSGWDWSVKQWMLDADALCRTLLAGSQPGSKYYDLLRSRAAMLGKSLFIQSDGTVWKQIIAGIMKSGSGWTSSSNSRIRAFLAFCAGVMRAMAMGDDALEEYLAQAKRIYEEYGLMIKDYKRSSLKDGGIEFCSIKFRDTVELSAPVKWAKLLGTLLQKTPRSTLHQEELMVAFRYDMRHSPFLEQACRLIVQSGWGLHKDGEESTSKEENDSGHAESSSSSQAKQ